MAGKFSFVFCGKTLHWLDDAGDLRGHEGTRGDMNSVENNFQSGYFSSSSLDDAEDSKTVIKDDKQEPKNNNKLPQVRNI